MKTYLVHCQNQNNFPSNLNYNQSNYVMPHQQNIPHQSHNQISNSYFNPNQNMNANMLQNKLNPTNFTPQVDRNQRPSHESQIYSAGNNQFANHAQTVPRENLAIIPERGSFATDVNIKQEQMKLQSQLPNPPAPQKINSGTKSGESLFYNVTVEGIRLDKNEKYSLKIKNIMEALRLLAEMLSNNQLINQNDLNNNKILSSKLEKMFLNKTTYEYFEDIKTKDIRDDFSASFINVEIARSFPPRKIMTRNFSMDKPFHQKLIYCIIFAYLESVFLHQIKINDLISNMKLYIEKSQSNHSFSQILQSYLLYFLSIMQFLASVSNSDSSAESKYSKFIKLLKTEFVFTKIIDLIKIILNVSLNENQNWQLSILCKLANLLGVRIKLYFSDTQMVKTKCSYPKKDMRKKNSIKILIENELNTNSFRLFIIYSTNHFKQMFSNYLNNTIIDKILKEINFSKDTPEKFPFRSLSKNLSLLIQIISSLN